MTLAQAIPELEANREVVVTPTGNSMTPLIKSGARCRVVPTSTASKGDVVLCRVNGLVYLHLVKAVKNGQYLIGNNHGGTNGWTTKVFGKFVGVSDGQEKV